MCFVIRATSGSDNHSNLRVVGDYSEICTSSVVLGQVSAVSNLWPGPRIGPCCVLHPFMMERNANFQFEISENMNVIIFLCSLKDSLNSFHGHSWLGPPRTRAHLPGMSAWLPATVLCIYLPPSTPPPFPSFPTIFPASCEKALKKHFWKEWIPSIVGLRWSRVMSPGLCMVTV